MSATESLCQLLGVNSKKLSKEENILLEAELFTRVCEELTKFYKFKYQEYFRLIKSNFDKESGMLEVNFLRCIVNDILLTEEYTLEGIACYTQEPIEVIYDILIGCNIAPSLLLSRKLIELHRSVRSNLYREIVKKIVIEHLAESA